MSKINDPTIYHFTFLLRWHGNDDDPEKERHWEAIIREVRSSWEWVHQQAKHKLPSFPVSHKEKIGRRQSGRLVGTDWLRHDERSFVIEARAILDSAYIQLGICANGKKDKDIFESLGIELDSRRASRGEDLDHVYLGESTCLWTELDEGDDPVEIAARCLSKRSDIDSSEIQTCRYPWGEIAIPTNNKSTVMILPCREEKAIRQASHFLNFVLPRLFLARIKARRGYDDYERRLYTHVEACERKLARLLEGRERAGSLEDHEDRTLDISDLQDELIERLCEITQWFVGFKANVRNIELILKDDVVQPNETVLWSIFGEDLRLAVEQVESDSGYFQSRNDEASLALRTLNNLIAVEKGRTDRRMMIILGLVASILAIGEILGENPNPFGITMIVVAFTATGWMILKGKGRRRKK